MTKEIDYEAKFKLPQDDDVEVLIDTETLPDAVKARLLVKAAKDYVLNSTSSAFQRWKKEGSKGEDTPDYAAVAKDAKARLVDDKMRATPGEGTGKTAKDPLDAVVTVAVVRDLFQSRKAKDPKVTYISITKEVGSSGVAYLTKLAGDDKAKLAKIEAKYLKPARQMLGINAKGENTEDNDDLI